MVRVKSKITIALGGGPNVLSWYKPPPYAIVVIGSLVERVLYIIFYEVSAENF